MDDKSVLDGVELLNQVSSCMMIFNNEKANLMQLLKGYDSIANDTTLKGDTADDVRFVASYYSSLIELDIVAIDLDLDDLKLAKNAIPTEYFDGAVILGQISSIQSELSSAESNKSSAFSSMNSATSPTLSDYYYGQYQKYSNEVRELSAELQKWKDKVDRFDEADNSTKNLLTSSSTIKEEIQNGLDSITVAIENNSYSVSVSSYTWLENINNEIDKLKTSNGLDLTITRTDELSDNTIAVQEMMEMYGFTEEEAKLVIKAIKCLEDTWTSGENTPEDINFVYGTLTALCISYDARRWRMTTGQPTEWQAENRLKAAGLTDQEILDLRVIINLQHGDFTYDTLRANGIDIDNSTFNGESNSQMQSRATDKNNDFAHQTVQITAFAWGDMMYEGWYFDPGRYVIDLFNSSDFTYTYTKYEISFKGDIDSGRYSESDFQSDVDAINIYNRMKNNTNGSMTDIWTGYYDDVESGATNRGTEFFEGLGDGDAGIGMLELVNILDKETFGSQYIIEGNNITEEELKKAKQIFTSWITSIHMGVDYDFPE